MPSYGCFVPVVSGETYPVSTPIGRPFTGKPALYYFNQWKTDGTPERINQELNQLDRKQEGREALPSEFSVDSQSVKLAPMICEYRGLDPHKKVNGRKRQLLVDTGGRLWAAHVHTANDADGSAALVLVSDICGTATESKRSLVMGPTGVFLEKS